MKFGIYSFKGTVAELRQELKEFREFMEFVYNQEGVISRRDLEC